MRDLIVGLDVGTTSTKILVVSAGDDTVVREQRVAIDWFGDGQEQRSLRENLRLLLDGIAEAVGDRGRVAGIGIASVAESGVLVSADGEDLTTPIAWHSPIGESEISSAIADLAPDEFAGATGLPITSLCSAAKIAYFHRSGLPVRGATWLTLGEYLAFRLSGRRAAEPSLASRTGLLRQDTLSPFTEVVRAVGGDVRLLPELVPAGESVGPASQSHLPAVLSGAAVTIAGHDHLVAAFASGVTGAGQVFNSAGTGDVILSVTEPSERDTRVSIVASGATSGTFLDGRSAAIVAGVRGGLVLETILSAIGASALTDRLRVDAAAARSTRMLEAIEDERVKVTGANKDAARVAIDIGAADVSPDELWWAALREVSRESTRLWALTRSLVPGSRVRSAGGWTRLESVRRAKTAVFGQIEFLPDLEAGALGAAAFAAAAASGAGYAGACEIAARSR